MLQTPERHEILAAAAARMAETLEAGARNPRFDEFERARYAELARMERLHQAYHLEAGRLAEQGIEAPEWIDWHQARERDPQGPAWLALAFSPKLWYNALVGSDVPRE